MQDIFSRATLSIDESHTPCTKVPSTSTRLLVGAVSLRSSRSVRQSIVNRFVLRECCSCVPFPSKARLVKRCSCSCHNLLERFALGWWEWCLCLLAKGCRRCTHTCGQRIVPFCADSGGKAFEAQGNVGGTAERTIERQGFSVACFGQRIVLLLAGQVAEQGRDDGNVPRHSNGLHIDQGFF